MRAGAEGPYRENRPAVPGCLRFAQAFQNEPVDLPELVFAVRVGTGAVAKSVFSAGSLRKTPVFRHLRRGNRRPRPQRSRVERLSELDGAKRMLPT